MGRWRITGVIFENSAPEGKYVILKIDKNGEAELVQADEYKRMKIMQLFKYMKQQETSYE